MHRNKSTRRIYAENPMIRTLIAGFIGFLIGLTWMLIIYPKPGLCLSQVRLICRRYVPL